MPDGLYERDILIWSEQQADLLRRLAAGERVNAAVDWANLIDEVESLGRSELNACESLLVQALVHLLKLQVHPGHDAARHWRSEAVAFLSTARRRFTPSMQGRINLPELYGDAVEALVAAYPERAGSVCDDCPFTLDELLQRAGAVADLLAPRVASR